MRARSAFAAALVSLLAAPVAGQLLCPNDPPLRIEVGPYRTRGFELTSEQFDAWLGNVRETCDWLAALDAGDVPYTPAVVGDWADPDPADVAAALDALAAGGGGGGTSIAEELTTTCTLGEGIVSDGAGEMDCSAAALAQVGHAHAAADTTSGTFADARISSSSVTQHETALEAVLDLADLQGDLALGTKTSGNYAAGDAEAGNATGLVCTTCVDATDIAAEAVTEAKLDALDAPGDEEVLTYEATGGRFEWQAASGGANPAGSGSELQYRVDATTFGAVPDSSVSSGDIVIGGGVRVADFADNGGMAFGFASDSGASGIWLQSGTGMHLRLSNSDKVTVTAAGVLVNTSVRMNPTATAPMACTGGGSAGARYYDSDINGFCDCNGTRWVCHGFNATQPTCDATVRGWHWWTDGAGGGDPDSYEVCALDTGDSYAWRELLSF